MQASVTLANARLEEHVLPISEHLTRISDVALAPRDAYPTRACCLDG
jgi:hypothetical protein